MPLALFVLGLSVFCLNTTEIMVAGLIPGISRDLGVSIAAAGDLVSIFALGMVVGGPLLIVGLWRVPQKRALVWLLVAFIAGQTLGALAQDYRVLVVARVLTALAASAFFGVSAAVCVRLVGPERRGRAMSVLYGGIMVAQVVGLPVATFVQQHLGWRASFWIVDALAVACLAAAVPTVPGGGDTQTLDLRRELRAFRNPRLWGAYATNALVIGSVVAGFTYLSPILTGATHFAPATVPVLFAVYGLATVVGNAVVGRFADRFMLPILLGGLTAVTLILAAFALTVDYKAPTVVATVLLGLIGLPLNPAMAARVMSVSNEGALVNTVNGSAINIGVVVGPWLGGLGISAGLGLATPLWIGSAMALCGLLTLIPDLGRRVRRRPRAGAASPPVPAGGPRESS